MQSAPTTAWHKASFDHCLHRALPGLLTERLGLSGYRAAPDGESACRIALQVPSVSDAFEVTYEALPAPDANGVFRLDPAAGAAPSGSSATPGGGKSGGREPRLAADGSPLGGQHFSAGGGERVVIPQADCEDLAAATIACVGEQLFHFIDTRLGAVPEEAVLDEALVRTLAPLEAWFHAFLAQSGQILNGNNWLDRATHLRRIVVPDPKEMFTPGHFGRACPFETPEGPNVGRILTVSRGAEIRDGRLVIVEDDPVAGLGLSAACVPFLEHDDGNRVLMGVNMMRQWLPAAEREPAVVQTGFEPDVPEFWCGANLLTAFVSWDGDAFEDAVVVSDSASRKLACPERLEPGDKLSNRHGTKGVVSRVVPDAEMPRLPDGTPVELVFSVSGVPSRGTVGQLREAVVGRIARAGDRPAVVPPFGAPSDAELRRRLAEAGLPHHGMETLTDRGAPLRRAGTAGWVYWGCLVHLVRDKLHLATQPDERPQRLGRMEVQALREAGAEAVIRELTNTCSAERADAATLVERVASGAAEPDRTPSPRFTAVSTRLAHAGIRSQAGADGVAFSLGAEGDDSLTLAEAVPHPWLPEEHLTEVWAPPHTEGFGQVADANQRLAQLRDSAAPDALLAEARQALTGAVAALYDGLVTPEDLTLGTQVLFSGRTVLTPGPDLAIDQLGLPEEMAWRLYGPQVAAELGDSEAVARRSETAAAALTARMAASWIVLNRAPSVGPTSLLAFHPVPIPQRAFRLHPLACRLLNADFDGDQAAVFAPLTAAAQQEAGARLSIAGHLERDPEVIEELFPAMDALFGLACLSRSSEGRQAIADLAGGEPELERGILTRHRVVELLRAHLVTDGPRAALRLAEELMRLGFAAARGEGASVGPFVGAALGLPEAPPSDDPDQWKAFMDETEARIALFDDYDDEDMGAVCLLSHSGARATSAQVATLCAAGGLVQDQQGNLVPVRGCWRGGLAPHEVMARAVGGRRGIQRVYSQYGALAEEHEARSRPSGHGVLARARRSRRPGVVFARAAARGEVDPATDEYARLFVGLSATQE